ncbi:hypothetical protein [Butyrivibrio sp. AE3009]|uniref:hypothetical protein n=1 Tax=Butyrivibrio sp. AE3009 TaxID=1280666 RepID=UPI0003B574A1|nr:hypothetical protein [Butyrivibrio sp. AE3009]
MSRNWGVMKAVNGILSNEYILRQTYATLDSTKNNCCVRYTDGEELRNNLVQIVILWMENQQWYANVIGK